MSESNCGAPSSPVAMTRSPLTREMAATGLLLHLWLPVWAPVAILLIAAAAACSTTPSKTSAVDAAATDTTTDADGAAADVADATTLADLFDTVDDSQIDSADAGVSDAPVDVSSAVVDADDAQSLDVQPDSLYADAGADGSALDVNVVPCPPGAKTCSGVSLAICAPDGQSWLTNACFAGSVCKDGQCQAVSNNIILIFDTSSSMDTNVQDASGADVCVGDFSSWPLCEDPNKFPNGCTRIGVSKAVFNKALAKLDDSVTHMALFRFPQTYQACAGYCSCSSGSYSGSDSLSTDQSDAYQHVDSKNSGTSVWYWSSLNEILSVPFPAAAGTQTKAAIGKWMDNLESAINPELRADGSTPIGKSLFYVGEYIRNVVVVDGKKCKVDSDCANANYLCDNGACKDPARSCRDTIVVLFTDGGETATNEFFGPWVQAKRLSMGLGCSKDADCAGDASCQTFMECVDPSGFELGSGQLCGSDADCVDSSGASIGKCQQFQQCMPGAQVTGYFCTDGGDPCLPTCTGDPKVDPPSCIPAPQPGEPKPSGYCAAQCVHDPRRTLTATAKQLVDNAVRSPDGKPIPIKLYVVDIGSTDPIDIGNSMGLAISGNGKLIGTSASDPAQFLQALTKAFDIKNSKVCGVAY